MAIFRARDLWETALNESTSRRWKQYPKHYTCLFEDYYEMDDRDERKSVSWSCIVTCLDNFFLSATWETLQKSRPTRWLALDDSRVQDTLVTVDGIPSFMVIDLGYDLSRSGEPRERCRLFDWKTGRPGSEDEKQLAYYALFSELKWGFRSDQVTARLVYLHEYDERNVAISEDMVELAKQEIQTSFKRMQSLLVDIETNTPLPISSFSVTKNCSHCRYCSFQEICSDRALGRAEGVGQGDEADPLFFG